MCKKSTSSVSPTRYGTNCTNTMKKSFVERFESTNLVEGGSNTSTTKSKSDSTQL